MQQSIVIESRTQKPAFSADLRKAGRKLLTAVHRVAMPLAVIGILVLWTGVTVDNPAMALRGAMAGAAGTALLIARIPVKKGGAL